MMAVKIQRSKTDQLREGDEILVTRTPNSTCPVSMLKQRYIRVTSIDQHNGITLFKKLIELGHPSNRFRLHSLRAGGETADAIESRITSVRDMKGGGTPMRSIC